MIYGSVCSGIEAATVAWHPLGWKPAFFSDIEKFPRAVLKHHYPNVPLHGDFTTIGAAEYGPIDLLVGGTPCQDFSIAGLRKGISGDRGNLTLEYVLLAQRKKPRWILWENVPGVLSSDGGGAFGSFLGGLAELGYGFAYRVLDAQYFGVPQRRRRVFVVGYLGDWRAAAAVLFERESLRGDITPRREAGKGVAPCIDARAGRSGENSFNTSGGLIPFDMTAIGEYGPGNLASTIKERDYKDATDLVCHTLRAEGFDASEDGTGRGTPLVPVAYPINTMVLGGRPDEVNDARMAFGVGNDGDPQFTLSAAHSHAVATSAKVRRLTPRECERLQGFPDDYTKITEKTTDSLRYRALGNSMAVPVMRWLGERIDKVDRML